MLGPHNLSDAKLPFVPIRPGSTRWYEAYNSNLQSLVHVFSHTVRKNSHVTAGDQTGKLVCAAVISAPTSGMNSVEDYNWTDPDLERPTHVLYEYDFPFHFGKTWGAIEFGSSHGETPGEVGYLSTTTPGTVTASDTSGVATGIYAFGAKFLFLPNYH